MRGMSTTTVSKLGAVIPRSPDDDASGDRSRALTCQEGVASPAPRSWTFPLRGLRPAPDLRTPSRAALRFPLARETGACLPPFPWTLSPAPGASPPNPKAPRPRGLYLGLSP